MASLGRIFAKLPKHGQPILVRSMGTQAQSDTHTGDPTPQAHGGINFILSETSQEYLDMAEKFTKEEIIPVAAHYDRTGEYPWEVLKKAHENGLMNLHIPEEYGGMGLGTLDGCLITEKNGLWLYRNHDSNRSQRFRFYANHDCRKSRTEKEIFDEIN